MSHHKATIKWASTTDSFSYDQYNRNHVWAFESGITITASAAPQFLGSKDCVDPEEAFVASIASCHMLTFLAVCSRRDISVVSYEDQAVGFLERDERNLLCVTQVVLKPVVTFQAEQTLDDDELRQLHEKAHQECFIANSVTTRISIEATEAALTRDMQSVE